MFFLTTYIEITKEEQTFLLSLQGQKSLKVRLVAIWCFDGASRGRKTFRSDAFSNEGWRCNLFTNFSKLVPAIKRQLLIYLLLLQSNAFLEPCFSLQVYVKKNDLYKTRIEIQFFV